MPAHSFDLHRAEGAGPARAPAFVPRGPAPPLHRKTQQRHRLPVVQAAAREHLSPLGERPVPQLTETPDGRWDCERLIG